MGFSPSQIAGGEENTPIYICSCSTVQGSKLLDWIFIKIHPRLISVIGINEHLNYMENASFSEIGYCY